MNTPRDTFQPIRFAVDFAQTNLERASLRRVSNSVRDFLTGLPGVARGASYALGDLAASQSDALAFLRTVAVNGVATVDLKVRLTMFRVDEERGTVMGGDKLVTGVDGALRDRFLYRLIQLLELAGVERLRACPAPDCGRLFLKVTRKEFCSTRCQKRIYMRQHPEYRDRISTTKTKGRRHVTSRKK